MSRKVVIIGAGFGGLATACLLAKAGYNVEVHEKNDKPGGRAGSFKAKGFKFDAGPSWYLMPEVFEHFFALLGEDTAELFDLKRLDPSYQIFYKDTLFGSVRVRSGQKHIEDLFESFEPGGRQKVKAYLADARHRYDLSIDRFLYRNYDSRLDLLKPGIIGQVSRLGLKTPLHTYVSSRFTSTELQKLLEYPMLFLGTDPRKAPSIYSLMTHVDVHGGVFYPMGGMSTITDTIVKLAKKYGVKIHCNSPISRIVTENGRAVAVKTQNKEIKTDLVICNADIEFAERVLLDKKDRGYSSRYWKKRVVGPSALLIYLGIKGSYDDLEHHNLVFSKDWEANFEAIFDKKRWPKDPSFYVCNPGKTDPKVAPKNHQNLFVLVPLPAKTSYTDEQLETYADHILETMDRTMHLPNLKQSIVYRKLFAAKDFEQAYNSYKGTALGLSHTLSQTAAMRTRNNHKKISNLYFVGAGTTPGVGLPMCLISAELVYKRLTLDSSVNKLEKL